MIGDIAGFETFLRAYHGRKIVVGADDLLWETTTWLRKKHEGDIPIARWWECKHDYAKLFEVPPESAYRICYGLHFRIAHELTLVTGCEEALWAIKGHFECSLVTMRLMELAALTIMTVTRLLPDVFDGCYVHGPTGPGKGPDMPFNDVCRRLGSELIITSSLSQADGFSKQDGCWAILLEHPINVGEVTSPRTLRFSTWRELSDFLLSV